MSFIQYGPVVLQMVKTNVIGREEVRSQDGTDQIYVKHLFDVDFVYNPEATSYSYGPNQQPGIAPAVTDVAIRTQLMAPRQQLIYAVDGIPILVSPPNGSSVDAWMGPMPISCSIKQINGTTTFMGTFRVETWVNECLSPQEAASNPIVSNRYQVNHTIDRQRLTTITSTGVTVFRMDALEQSIIGGIANGADSFRSKVLPPIPDTFQRQAIDIKITPDGSKLLWTTVDREMVYYLGNKQNNIYGVEWFEATYTQSANPPDGAAGGGGQSIFVTGNFACRVVGNKDSFKSNLITFAVALAIQRCQIKAGAVVGQDALIRQVSVSETIHDRMIDFNLVIMYPPARGPNAVGLGGIQQQYLGIDILDLINKPFDNLQMPFDGNSRGTFVGEAMAAALKEACSQVDLPSDEQQASEGPPKYPTTTYEPPAVTTSVVDNLETQTNRYSNETSYDGAYTEYKIEGHFDRSWGKIACPVAGSPTASSTSGSTARLAAENRPGAPTYFAPEILTVCSPIQFITYKWVVERNATVPNIPDWDLTTKNLTLLSDDVRPAEQYLAGDGVTPVFRIEGIYRYCRNDAEDLSVSFPFPIVPWTDFEYAEYKITEENLKHGYIDDPNSSTSGGGGTPAIEPPGIVR